MLRAADFLSLLNKHFSPRSRRVWMTEGRAHVELRSGDRQELEAVGRKLQQLVEKHAEMRWAEVHSGTQRVVFSFVPGSFSEDQLVQMVAEVELGVGLASALLPEGEHPADREPSEEVFLQLCGEVAGFLLGSSLKLSIFPRSRLAATLASALLVVQSVPRLRRGLDDRWGRERTDLGLTLLSSLLEGPAQRPLNNLVGIVEKTALLSELRTQKRLWESQEGALAALPQEREVRSISPRPVPLPRGPIEEYAERAWAVALGGFAVSFVSTRSVQRAVGALFGGIPRPARLGREVFSSALSRMFAARHMLVLDRQALRILDRVDCLVIQGELMPTSQVHFGRVVSRTQSSWEMEEAKRLFEPKAPLSVQKDGELRLGPLPLLGVECPAEMEAPFRELMKRGEVVLGLAKGNQLEALLEVRLRSRLGLEELVQAAHDAKMQVILASSDPDVLQSIPADDTFEPGEGLVRGVRQLQREGRVVCVLAQGDNPGLDVADLAVSVTAPGEPVAWSASILCQGELDDVRFLIEACRVARDVSRQSVNIALAAASLGALASVGGLVSLTTNRVLTVVNVASLASMGNGVRLAADFARRPLLPPRDPTPWHALSAEGSLARLQTPLSGLSKREVGLRKRRREVKRSAAMELAAAVSDELFNPLVPLLAAGAGLSAVVGSFADALMVGGVVGLNAVVGGAQRFRTERAISELSRGVVSVATVKRDEQVQEISSEELVKGDLLLLASGDLVPADCRLIEAQDLKVDASGLTGESLPVSKQVSPSFEENIVDRSSMLYAGTTVVGGRATAVVVATGGETEARRAVAAFPSSLRESGVERRMRELMDLTAPVAALAGAGVLGAGFLRGRKLEELAGSAVSLAVASVPEGLPLLATAAQLAAARRLSKQGVLVRNVRALEALGRVDILCVDKTGTVTEGALALSLLTNGEEKQSVEELSAELRPLLAASLRASASRRAGGARVDPLELALFRGADRLQVTASEGAEGLERLAELPFEAARGYHATLTRSAAGLRLSVKGAPEALIQACSFRWQGEQEQSWDETARERMRLQIEELAEQGFRVLAVAEKQMAEGSELSADTVSDLGFLGLLAFRDPVRKSARETLAELRRAGLRPVMITGDHPSTARAIFTDLGLGENPVVLTGTQLAQLSDEELFAQAADVHIFARVSPSQKVRIVRALQREGRTVAMVGDGANDAPAIRLASVGVAMGEHCAEAARNAADIVLRDARIETLLRAIVEGRAVWESVRDAVSILVGGNLGEIGFTLVGGLFSGRPPLSARQLLLVNLFTDVAPATALALRAPRQTLLDSLLEAGPDASLGDQLNRAIGARALITASGAGLAWTAASFLGDRKGASTTALLALVGSQLGQTLTSGERSRQVLVTNLATVAGLLVIVQTPGLSGAFGCRPLGPLGWGIALSSSVVATSLGRYAPAWVDRFWTEDLPFSLPRLPFLGKTDTGRGAQELGQLQLEAPELSLEL